MNADKLQELQDKLLEAADVAAINGDGMSAVGFINAALEVQEVRPTVDTLPIADETFVQFTAFHLDDEVSNATIMSHVGVGPHYHAPGGPTWVEF